MILNGKPQRTNRIRLLWKLKQYLSKAIWSLHVHSGTKQECRALFPELNDQEFNKFVKEYNNNPDKANIIFQENSLHYGGIPYDENSKVSIKISFNKDGTFLNPPEILEQERMDKPGEEYFKVIAESALRALRRCFPDESLDFKNYNSTQLSNIILNFDPTEILR